ncbi:MAG: hypothetical protein ACR2HK_13390, partial [Gemmatimonadales bacterium]
LRLVRAGHPLTLLCRGTPIAVVLPWNEPPPALPVRLPTRRVCDLELPTQPITGADSMALLREERDSEH